MQASQDTMKAAMRGDEKAARCMYLEYVNNFLTVKGFSDYYGIGQSSGQVYIGLWRELHEAHCANVKALGAEYEALIGYNPFSDDPSISVETVRQTLADYKACL